MIPPGQPGHEAQRLETLQRYNVLDTPPEQALDDLTTLAAQICDAPISLIALTDGHRQWFKSTVGLGPDELSRDASFCAHAILHRDLFVVPDATNDDRFAHNPLVTGEARIRFYAGAPLVTPHGYALGTLSVMDRVPRTLSQAQRDAVSRLGRQVMAHFELRYQMSESLASEKRLLQVFRSCPVGMAIQKWSDGTFVDVNAAFTSLVGWAAEDVAGRTTAEMHIIDEEASAALRSRLISDRKLHDAEVVLTTRQGKACHALIGTEIVDLRGEPHAITTFVDVTDRRRAEEERHTIESRYRTLFEHAPDGIVIADSESYYLDANPSICRMLGYTRDELIGLHASDIVAPAETQHIDRALTTIKTTGAYHRDWLFRHKDGSTVPAEVIATTLPDGKLLGMIRDVTERNRTIEALQHAEERMRFTMQSAEVGTWDMDYSTGVLTWSEILEAQYGLLPGTFGGTFDAYVERIHPEDRESVIRSVTEARNAGGDFSLNHRAVRPDGTVRWLTVAGRILLGDDGQLIRGVGISLDVTDHHALEAQFQQAQKMEAIGRLAGGIAHDFNNLLTAILGYCELLIASLDPKDPRLGDVSEIQKAGRSGAGLTRQLLAFSRKQIIEPTLLDLNSVVADMQGILERVIGEDVKIVMHLQRDRTSVMADRGQVEQIVLNLAVNGRDAMPTGGTLTIETASVELDQHYARTHLAATPGPYAVLTISDTGVGMTPEVQARLFEPFFTTKEPGKGTGLGLATVHGIVARYGGSVNVYSELGRGTAFKVYFPRVESTQAAADRTVEPVSVSTGPLTILVVEDAAGLRALAKRLLEQLGYSVLVASNAEEARALCEQHPLIDVLLTDVVMPGMSGPALARELVASRPTLKTVYMSGYTDEAIVQHGILKPGIAFLQKPFTSRALAQKIHDVLGTPL